MVQSHATNNFTNCIHEDGFPIGGMASIRFGFSQVHKYTNARWVVMWVDFVSAGHKSLPSLFV